MKKRLGFISNSSSSSFICDCGHSIVLYDDNDLADSNVEKCENGHYICNECLPENLDHYHNINKYLDLDDYDEDGYLRLIKKQYCPYCTLETISDYDLKRFLFRKYSLNEKNILKEIKIVFKNYENFKKYINS